MNMLDAMQARMWEAWRSDDRPVDAMFSSAAMRTVSDQIRRQEQARKESQRKAIESELYCIKDELPPTIVPVGRTILGRACRNCVPGSQDFLDPIQRRRNVNNVLKIENPPTLSKSSAMWNFTSMFNVISQVLSIQYFAYPQMSHKVIPDERMRAAIEQAAKESLAEKKERLTKGSSDFNEAAYFEKMTEKHRKRAAELLVVLQSKISHRFLQWAMWLVYKLMPTFLSGVVVHPAHIDMLKEACKAANNVPIIYLPLHRSHLDYILVTFILMNNNLRAPIVAAGSNLNIPFFG